MDNRFGVKDFILFLVLGLLIVLIVLAMFQYDRQWDQIQLIRGKLDDQAKEMRFLAEKLQSGALVHAGGPSTTQSAAGDDPFIRLREVEAMPQFARGDWVISSLAGKSSTLTPYVSGDAYASDVQSLVLDTLADRDPQTLDWRPLLATKWEIADNTKAYFEYLAANPTTQPTPTATTLPADPNRPYPVVIHFDIREGVRFSDGEPLTADDVVFTFNFVMDPKINAPRSRAYLEKIAKVERSGPNRVSFYFREPYFEAFELAATFQVLPRHYYGKLDPETFNQSTGMLIGSGPYKLEAGEGWTPDKPIELIRNERYWGVSPPVERIVYRVINNDVARLTSFRNGEIDTYASPPEAYVKLKDDPAMAEKAQRFEYFPASGGYRYVAWNQLKDGKPTPFADKNVRRALAMVIDRDRLMKEITLGYAQLSTGPFSPLSKQFDNDVKALPFDVEAGRKLLTEAGYIDRDGDGVVESPKGEPFRFKLTYPTGISNYERQALFIKDSLSRVGVAMDADPLEWSVFQQRLEQKNFDAISLGWTSGIETDIYQMFHGSQTMAGGDNFMSYKNAELDQAIDKARSTLDEESRMKLWNRCHQILNEDQPYMFLWFGKSLTFVDKRFENVRQLRSGLTPRTEWYVPQDRQRWTRN